MGRMIADGSMKNANFMKAERVKTRVSALICAIRGPENAQTKPPGGAATVRTS